MIKLSPSKINTYNTCPLQYDWIYNKKLISIKGDALELGSSYHELVRQYHVDGKEHREKLGKDYELLWCYIKNPINGNIIDTEKKINFTIELPNGETVEINIILDRIDEDKLIDYKTSSADYTDEDCRNIQSLLYVYWYWISTGKIYPFVFHVVNKKKIGQKKYVPQIMKEVIYTEKELKEVPLIIQRFVEKEKEGNFQATPSPRCWGCGFGPMGLDYCTHYKEGLYKK